MAFVIVKGLQRTALFFISLLGVGEGGGAEPYRQANTKKHIEVNVVQQHNVF